MRGCSQRHRLGKIDSGSGHEIQKNIAIALELVRITSSYTYS
jgi:hypothetical protein